MITGLLVLIIIEVILSARLCQSRGKDNLHQRTKRTLTTSLPAGQFSLGDKRCHLSALIESTNSALLFAITMQKAEVVGIV